MSIDNSQKSVSYLAITGRVIAELRKQQGITQSEMAESVGVQQPTWSRIEKGLSGISTTQLLRASKCLGLKPHEVLERVDNAANRIEQDHNFSINDAPPKNQPASNSGETAVAGLLIGGVIALIIAGLASR